MIIGISGKIGSGKDTLFAMLKELDPRLENKKFAAKLKQRVALTWGCRVEDLEDSNFKQLTSPLGITWRELLQIEGCLVRDHVDVDYWPKALFVDYQPIFETQWYDNETSKELRELGFARAGVTIPVRRPRWVITDVRFPNEADAILDRGGKLIRLEGNHTGITSNHKSETALDNYKKFTHRYENTGSLQALQEFGAKVLSNL